MVLGPLAENAMRQSLLMSGGSFLIFLTRPICLFFIIIAFLSVVMTGWKKMRGKA